MSTMVLIARIVLGLMFFVFGLNFFFNFISFGEMPPEAGAFMGALVAAGYLFPFMKVIEILCGFMLLIGWRVPLALTLLAPIIVNIFLFHVFLAPDPMGLGMAVLIVVLEIFLAWAYRESFRGVLGNDKASI